MTDERFWEPVISQLLHPDPCHRILLAASSKRPPPKIRDIVPEHPQRRAIVRHGVIVEETGNDLPQPFPLFRDRLMQSPSQLLFYHLQSCLHAVPSGSSLDDEFTPAGFAADEGEVLNFSRI